MNYLAHAYLSFNDPGILTGNMISDFIKGKKKFEYTAIIQKGIALHRAIDEYTDLHQSTKKAKLFFKADYGLYGGAFVDIVYDHFLANDESEFSEQSLNQFSIRTYELLNANADSFPANFKRLFNYMRAENWLFGYRLKQGIYKSFAGLVRRASYMHEYQTAFGIFEKNYNELEVCYKDFFPSVKDFASDKLEHLLIQ